MDETITNDVYEACHLKPSDLKTSQGRSKGKVVGGLFEIKAGSLRL